MNWIIENWYLIIALMAVLAAAGLSLFLFLRKPTESQIESVKEWLLYAVTEAEKALGSGTGQLKLRYVYDKFIDKFPYVSETVPFDDFSEYVDEALGKMRYLINTNKSVKEYVKEEQ
jgi:hypothetical protein